MSRSARENLIFLLIAHICFLAEPAILSAEEANYNPQPFTQALRVAHGTVRPIGSSPFYFNASDRCRLTVDLYGWEASQCDAIDGMFMAMGPEVDTLLISKPVMEGRVQLDDWDQNVDSAVSSITDSYKEGLERQSKVLGKSIRFVGWSLYPQIDRAKKVLYFGILSNWGEPNNTLNIRILQFDRYGYVAMQVVPTSADLNAVQIKQLVDDVTASYKPDVSMQYASFVSGDKVAAYGALGAFAAALGVKYSKGIATGILAIAFLLLKKLWLVILLPFLWLKRIFSRGGNAPPAVDQEDYDLEQPNLGPK
jgi:hypothetical protein